jgi:hypothetical protein
MATNEEMTIEQRKSQPLVEKMVSLFHKIFDNSTSKNFKERYEFPKEELGTGYFVIPTVIVKKRQSKREK